MKKQTLYEYSRIIISLLIVTFVTSIFGFISFISDSETTSKFSNNKINDITVIIDPGHGGEDGGAVGLCGTLEKDINLEISSILRDLFTLVDIDAVMTRNSDNLLYTDDQSDRKKFYDLKNRVDFADKYSDPVFLSIHQNKFPIEKYKGLQVYYSKNNPSGKELAECIQNNTESFLQKDNNRKIKEAGRNIFVLDKLQCPAVLIECGFLSNAYEEQNLNNYEYQKKLAYIIFTSVVEYLADSSFNNQIS